MKECARQDDKKPHPTPNEQVFDGFCSRSVFPILAPPSAKSISTNPCIIWKEDMNMKRSISQVVGVSLNLIAMQFRSF